MAISIKKLTLWSGEVANRPGSLGSTLEPLKRAGCNLGVVMAYAKPGDHARSVVELAPISGSRATGAARASGLAASPILCLVVDGDDRPGLGQAITSALGEAGINIHFLVALAAGKKYRVVFGFGPEVNLSTATRAIRSAGAASRPSRHVKPAAAKKRRKTAPGSRRQ